MTEKVHHSVEELWAALEEYEKSPEGIAEHNQRLRNHAKHQREMSKHYLFEAMKVELSLFCHELRGLFPDAETFRFDLMAENDFRLTSVTLKDDVDNMMNAEAYDLFNEIFLNDKSSGADTEVFLAFAGRYLSVEEHLDFQLPFGGFIQE